MPLGGHRARTSRPRPARVTPRPAPLVTMIIDFCVPSQIDACRPQRAADLLAQEITGLRTIGSSLLGWQSLPRSERAVVVPKLDAVLRTLLHDDDAVADRRTGIVRSPHGDDAAITHRVRSVLLTGPPGTAAVWSREAYRPCTYGPPSGPVYETVLVTPKGSVRVWRIRCWRTAAHAPASSADRSAADMPHLPQPPPSISNRHQKEQGQ